MKARLLKSIVANSMIISGRCLIMAIGTLSGLVTALLMSVLLCTCSWGLSSAPAIHPPALGSFALVVSYFLLLFSQFDLRHCISQRLLLSRNCSGYCYYSPWGWLRKFLNNGLRRKMSGDSIFYSSSFINFISLSSITLAVCLFILVLGLVFLCISSFQCIISRFPYCAHELDRSFSVVLVMFFPKTMLKLPFRHSFIKFSMDASPVFALSFYLLSGARLFSLV